MSTDLDSFLNSIDDANSNPGQGGNKLRQLLEQALSENKTLKEQFATVQAAERSRSVEALLAKHSVPALAKDFFPDTAELTDESVTAFVEKYGQLWGATAQQAVTDPEAQAATNTMQAFTSQASQPPAAPMSEEAYRAKFAEATTREELLRQIAEAEGSMGM